MFWGGERPDQTLNILFHKFNQKKKKKKEKQHSGDVKKHWKVIVNETFSKSQKKEIESL